MTMQLGMRLWLYAKPCRVQGSPAERACILLSYETSAPTRY